MDALSDIQMYAGQKSGSNAIVHTMSNLYEQQETEGFTAVDATNAFSGKVLFRNIKILCLFFIDLCFKLLRASSAFIYSKK